MTAEYKAFIYVWWGKANEKIFRICLCLKALYVKRKKIRVNSKRYVGYGGEKILTACINPYNQPIHTTDIFIKKESIFFLKRTVYCEKALPVDGQSEFVLPGDRFSLHHLLPASATERHCWGELCLGTMCFSFYDFTHPWWFVLASPCLCVQV